MHFQKQNIGYTSGGSSKNSKVKAIVFDLGNTLLDTRGLRRNAIEKGLYAVYDYYQKHSRLRDVIKTISFKPHEMAEEIMNSTGQGANLSEYKLRNILSDLGVHSKDLDLVYKIYFTHYIAALVSHNNMNDNSFLFIGAKSTLEKLYSDYNLYLMSKGPDEIRMEEVAASGLYIYFDKFFFTRSKDAYFYKKMLNEIGMIHSPEGVVVVGDNEMDDIKIPKSLGMWTVRMIPRGFYDGSFSNTVTDADHKIANLSVLSSILEKINKILSHNS